jgi:hypothetical protein
VPRPGAPAPPRRPRRRLADQGEGPPIASEPPFGHAPTTRAGATHPGRPRPSQARRDPPGPARPTRTHRGPLDQPGPAQTSTDPAAPEPARLTNLQTPPSPLPRALPGPPPPRPPLVPTTPNTNHA